MRKTLLKKTKMLKVWNYKTWTRELANQRPDEALYLFVTVCYCTVHGNHSHRFRLIGKKTDYKSGIQNFDAFNSEEWQYPVPYLYKLFILIILIHELILPYVAIQNFSLKPNWNDNEGCIGKEKHFEVRKTC